MTAQQATRNGVGIKLTVIFILLFAAIWAAVELIGSVQLFSTQHAIERHGEVSVTIRHTCEQRPKLDMTRSTDGRRMLGCEYEDGKFGVSVYEDDGDFVTAYPVKKALREFFRVRGYGR